ncbi:MAG: asparagine synthetase B, partial [Bacteroidota bacterium]
MCRIAGLYNPGEKNPERCVSAMRDAMKHGGPDDAGIYIHPELSFALGHRRLSLIDLTSTGHQPMEDPQTGNILIFNGEIYNYKELRSTLRHYGYSFQSE